MNYFILRDGLQYGPYSRAELQRYLRSGDLYPGDLGRSAEMKQWLPVFRLLGAAVPPPPASAAISGAEGSELAEIGTGAIALPSRTRSLPQRSVLASPDPPSLRWGVLLTLMVLTCGMFGWFWSFVIARWARAIDCSSRASSLLAFSFAFNAASTALLFVDNPARQRLAFAALELLAIVLLLLAMFSLRRSVSACYLSRRKRPLVLSAVMTFFFGIIYFQFKFNREMPARCCSPIHIDAPPSTP